MRGLDVEAVAVGHLDFRTTTDWGVEVGRRQEGERENDNHGAEVVLLREGKGRDEEGGGVIRVGASSLSTSSASSPAVAVLRVTPLPSG
jgi:hypothetical protein